MDLGWRLKFSFLILSIEDEEFGFLMCVILSKEIKNGN